jgi:hypothetical protein
MTQAARLNLDAYLSRPWLPDVSLDHLERSAGSAHLHRTHRWHLFLQEDLAYAVDARASVAV